MHIPVVIFFTFHDFEQKNEFCNKFVNIPISRADHPHHPFPTNTATQ